MTVDSISYMTNIYAESIVRKGEKLDEHTRMWIQVWIPSISVALLFGATVYNTVLAVQIIVLDPSTEEDVDVLVMFIFAGMNALVDLVSLGGFYMNREEIFSPDRCDKMRVSRHSRHSSPYVANLHLNVECSCEKNDEETLITEHADTSACRSSEFSAPLVTHEKKCPHHVHEGSIYDLNMLSAFTHVFGDTMRTFAIFGAAVAATSGHQKGALCDAWAMVVSTITIIAMLIPLTQEIWKAAHKHV